MSQTSRRKGKNNVSNKSELESKRVTTSRSSITRQEKRSDRLYNKTQLIKKIDGHMRYLRSQKRNASEEFGFIYEDQIQWFGRLKGVARAANEDDLSIFQTIYSDFHSRQEKSDDEIKRLFFFIICIFK